ncbi:S8 family serine peptidase [Fontisphaera persica]|uniref:S8 family serine peptidase n=1 Tax=Fontisphaera persica TaxID=2974023 RepID=UPI0024C05705|nr:S8 family serine peptidase [Fontisphaera persica]WCJ60888.1 S8 family serine peptidase [Fontisphaera persica]
MLAVSLPAADMGPALVLWTGTQAGILRVEKQLPHQLQKKWLPNDARLSQQWHLFNTGQNGGLAGVDLRLTNVWEDFRGAGVVVAMVDDGVELSHRDLRDNASPSLSYDYLEDDPDASPALFSDTHGTQVAGVAAARGNNGLGVCGVAPQATLASVRLISGPTTDAQEALALSHAVDRIHIVNCSWGAPDGQRRLTGPGPLTRAALRHGTKTGRGGRGVIYVFSAGNGAQTGEDANMDGYVNAIQTLAVGAVDDRGQITAYSEGGACVHVVGPSGAPLRQKITTTDLSGPEGEDPDDYTAAFTGTSASAPAVAGVVALMLEANPNLGWRDVQEILMRTARPIETNGPLWMTNAAGFRFHPRGGAGLVQAEAAVALAQQWTPLPAQTHWTFIHSNLPLAIPDNQPGGVTLTFNVPSLPLRVEHVVLTLSIAHPDLSQVEVSLQSPHGTTSLLLPANSLESDALLNQWPFTSVRHWGELAGGTWQVRISDVRFLDTGSVTEAHLELYGALLPEPVLNAPTPNAVFLVLPAVDGLTPFLEATSRFTSWNTVPWTSQSNRTFIYQASPLPNPHQFFRIRWLQP